MKKINNNNIILKISIFALSLILIFLSGCTDPKAGVSKAIDNTAAKELSREDLPEKMLALIINEPTKKELDKVKHIKKLTLDEEGTAILIVPTYKDTNIKVFTLELNGTDLVQRSRVFEEKYTEDSHGVLVHTYRPEGIPQYKIIVEYKGKSGEYIISYNGKDGHPHFEYILEDMKV